MPPRYHHHFVTNSAFYLFDIWAGKMYCGQAIISNGVIPAVFIDREGRCTRGIEAYRRIKSYVEMDMQMADRAHLIDVCI